MEWNSVLSTIVSNRPSVTGRIAREVSDVGHLERGCCQPLPGGLGLGQLDRGGRSIQPDGVVPQRRHVQRQRRLAAAGVEHVALDLALVDQRGNLRLRLAQTPRRSSRPELGASPR